MDYITPPEQDENPNASATYLRLTTQYGICTERGTGRTDRDTTPNYPLVEAVEEPTRSTVIGGT